MSNMIDFLFWISYTLLWILVLVLAAGMFFIYRYEGQRLLNTLEGRLAQGPDVGKQLPRQLVQDSHGIELQLGQARDIPLFLFFGSTLCEPCQEARPALGAFADKYREQVETLLVCAGAHEEVLNFAADLPTSVKIVPDPNRNLLAKFRVSSTPFQVIVDRAGVVRGKATTIKLEGFERLLTEVQSTSKGGDVLHETPNGFVPVTSIDRRS